jgi:hypothetical protein
MTIISDNAMKNVSGFGSFFFRWGDINGKKIVNNTPSSIYDTANVAYCRLVTWLYRGHIGGTTAPYKKKSLF